MTVHANNPPAAIRHRVPLSTFVPGVSCPHLWKLVPGGLFLDEATGMAVERGAYEHCGLCGAVCRRDADRRIVFYQRIVEGWGPHAVTHEVIEE